MSRPTQRNDSAVQPLPRLVVGSGDSARVATLDESGTYRLPDRQVDVCFVFDTTGSMSNKIDGLIAAMSDLVREIEKLDLDWRVTVLPFGDLRIPGDRIVTDLPFTQDVGEAVAQIRQMPRFSGGANQGESVLDAVAAALDKPYRPRAVKVLIVLTDEPAYAHQLTPDVIGERLRNQEALAFAITPWLDYYQQWAEQTGGVWFNIDAGLDHTTIVEMLRQLGARVAEVSAAVHELAGGSVRRYLELPRSSRA